MNELTRCCLHALKHNLGVSADEEVLVVTDRNKRSIGEAFAGAAGVLTEKVEVVEIPVAQFNGQEPPAYVAQKMLGASVVLMPVTMSLSWTHARMAATEQGVRIASMGGGLQDEIILRTFCIDYAPIRRRVNQICDLLDRAEAIRITTSAGTDISFRVRGRRGRGRKGGIYTEKGAWGNLPCGEAFTAPVEGETNGVYVIDASQAGVGRVEQPIKVTVRDGFAVGFEGGQEATVLRKMLEQVGSRLAFNIAELGIGCNDKARVTGATIEDEKVLGTCHIALGSNIFFGGNVDAGIHVDGILTAPSIWFDDLLIMKEGRLQAGEVA